MKIPFILNDEDFVIDAEPDQKLLYLLRNNGLFSVKCGCEEGFCNCCIILLDNKPVPACILPIAAVRGRSVVTLEHFKTTVDYEDISKGFQKAGVTLCGFCDSGKILTAYQIINKDVRPTKEEIKEDMNYLECKCTTKEVLLNGIMLAATIRRERTSGNKHGKK